jgi:DNA repair protein RecN (Recombination protein N)
MDDIAEEFASAQDAVESDPAQLEEVGNRLQLLYDLQKKHQAADVEELIRIKNELSVKVEDTQRLDTDIEEKKMELEGDRRAMEEQASGLSNRRQKVIPELKDQLEALLHSLGIPNAAFNLVLQPTTEYRANGKDTLLFLFSANKGGAFGELKKVASGGELSRIMLAIKSVLARYEPLPTMMFDEIDTGVSGEISNRMAEIMLQMSKSMQVFSITHLPQVASKGDQHFKVFKEDDGAVTRTRIRELGPDERIVELAEMLGGKSLSDSALAHARQLLN